MVVISCKRCEEENQQSVEEGLPEQSGLAYSRPEINVSKITSMIQTGGSADADDLSGGLNFN